MSKRRARYAAFAVAVLAFAAALAAVIVAVRATSDKRACMVIARYKEDLSWVAPLVEQLPYVSDVVVYNKGPRDDLPPSFAALERAGRLRVVHLENKGREGDTYIQHIRRHYDAYARGRQPHWTIFLQGDPFDQCPDLVELLLARDHWKEPYQPFSSIWFVEKGVPPQEFYDANAVSVGGSAKSLTVRYDMRTLKTLDFEDDGDTNVLARHVEAGCGTLQDVLREYDIPIDWEVGRFHYGGMFAVTTPGLLRHPRQLYDRIQAYIDRCGNISAYMLERLWLMLFSSRP